MRNLLVCSFGYSHEIVLRAERCSCMRSSEIFSIRLQKSRFHVIGEVCSQYLFTQPRMQIGLGDWKDHFASLDEISGHPIGASAVHLLFSAVSEAEDSAVLQESPYDAPHAYAFAEPFDPGAQRAHTAHDQVDLHAGLRGSIQRLDRPPIQKPIHLRNDCCRLSCFGVGGLSLDQGNEAIRQRQRRYQQGAYRSRTLFQRSSN